MSKSKPARTVDDLAQLIEELMGHLQVLVAAVDDLRSEVEWWARNASVEATQRLAEASRLAVRRSDESPFTRDVTTAIESAAQALAQFERSLMATDASDWPCGDAPCDAPALPLGEVLQVDALYWEAVLAERPAHVVGGDCECEPDFGGPLLFAWRDARGAYLLELSEADARELQRRCLAAQAEMQSRLESDRAAPQPQRGLW
jgi:hypothetical protein